MCPVYVLYCVCIGFVRNVYSTKLLTVCHYNSMIIEVCFVYVEGRGSGFIVGSH